VLGSTLSVSDASGTCNVTATKAADTNYNIASSAALPVALTKANQDTLTITALTDLSYLSNPYTLSTTGGSGTGAVTYSHGSSTVCTVVDDKLSLSVGDGTCTVTATKAADANYNEITDGASGEVSAGFAAIIGTIQGIGFGSLSAMSFLFNQKLFDKLFGRRRKQKGSRSNPEKEG